MAAGSSERRRAPQPERFAAAAEAERHYRRMWRLRRMDEGQLKALLSGPAADTVQWIESAARYGVLPAQVRLGQMLLDGSGRPRDEAAALAWFEKGARGGSAEAMNMAGRCYENGWGAPADLEAAARWYRLSAEAGCDWGEYNYANLLFDGRGVVRDLAAAVLWYDRSAKQGHARAMNLLARCCEEGWGVESNPNLAAQWYRRSAEGGYFRAQFNWATLLAAQGRTEEALAWFEKALSAATPDSLPAMTRALAERDEPSLAQLGRRWNEPPAQGASA